MNNNTNSSEGEESAIDDLRRIRKRIEHESAGDIQAHIEESRGIAEEYREELGLEVVEPNRPLLDREGRVG